MDDIDRRLLALIQHALPMEKSPFTRFSASLRLAEPEVIDRLRRLRESGLTGPLRGLVDLKKMGFSPVLSLLKVSQTRMAEAASRIENHPAVVQACLRDHGFNVWLTFLVSSPSEAEAIARGFGVADETAFPPCEKIHGARPPKALKPDGPVFPMLQRRLSGKRIEWSERELRVMRFLQDELPLDSRPFAAMGRRLGMREDECLGIVKFLERKGLLKKISAAVNFKPEKPGPEYDLLLMRVPEENDEAVASRLLSLPEVVSCCRRPPLPEIPYNVYVSLNIPDEASFQTFAAALLETAGAWPWCVLPRRRDLKNRAFRLQDAAVLAGQTVS